MVGYCAAFNCKEKFVKGGFSFHSFPKDPSMCKKWVNAVRRKNFIPTKHSKLCAKHFSLDAFNTSPWSSQRVLKPHAIPTIFDFTEHVKKPEKPGKPPKLRRKPASSLISVSGAISKDLEEPSTVQLIQDLTGHIHSHQTINVKLKASPHEESSPVVHASEISGECGSDFKFKAGTRKFGRYEIKELDTRKAPPTDFSGGARVIVVCFVCRQAIPLGSAIHLSVPTVATKVTLHRHLESLLNMKGRVALHEVVCGRCFSLLSYVDRMEEELKVLKGAMLMCARVKLVGADIQSEAELKTCKQILDRFSRGLGEKQYLMSLEDIFSLKAAGGGVGVNTDESVAMSNIFHSDIQHVGAGNVEKLIENGSNGQKRINDGTSVAVDVGKEVVTMDEQRHTRAAKVKGYMGSNEEESTMAYPVEFISGELGHLGKSLGATKHEIIQPKVLVTSAAIERYSAVESVEESPLVGKVRAAFLEIRPKTHSCQICSFKTDHQSVMIWHLRQHVRKRRRCDYCAVELPELRPPLAPPEEIGLQNGLGSGYSGTSEQLPHLMEVEVPDYPVVEVLSCSERFYKNVCKICSFKTDHDSVMMWHLRMHMKTCWLCDYCSESIPEHESSKRAKCKHRRKPVSKKAKGVAETATVMDTSRGREMNGAQNSAPVSMSPSTGRNPVTSPMVPSV